jgi:hypothetical protein
VNLQIECGILGELEKCLNTIPVHVTRPDEGLPMPIENLPDSLPPRKRKRKPRHRREYQRSWRATNVSSVQQSQAKYKTANRDARRARDVAWKAANKVKVAAHKKVWIAVKNGTLVKPLTCSRCGGIKRLHAHHEDYGKPLEVVWVCSSCHKLIHEGLLP